MTMKIIEIIKQKLGLDDNDLDQEMDLDSVKRMQMHLDDVADQLIQEQTQKELEKQQQESKDWAERMRKARQGDYAKAQARKNLRHQAGISPARLRKLKAEGKL